MKRADEHARRDPHRFVHVVVLELLAVVRFTPKLSEDDDQIGRDLEEGLSSVRAERRERVEPVLRCTLGVESALLLLGCDPDLPFLGAVGDHREMPGLPVGAAGSRGGSLDAMLDHLARDVSLREVTDASATSQLIAEAPGATLHLVGRVLDEVFERIKTRVVQSSPPEGATIRHRRMT